MLMWRSGLHFWSWQQDSICLKREIKSNIEHVGLVELQLGAVEISQEAEVDIGDEFVEETSDVVTEA